MPAWVTAKAMTPHDYTVLLEAKREVVFLIKYGQLISPKDAWLLAGQKTKTETLWSVAFRIGTQHDLSPEDVHRYLESEFPRYAMNEGRAHGWDDHHSSSF